MPDRRGHGWWPYWFPFFGFLILVQIGGSFPEHAGLFLFLKVAVPLGLFLGYWARGSYPELRGYPGGVGAVAADVGVGLLGAALWVAPPILIDAMRPEEPGFDPTLLGASAVGLALGVRAVGYGLVTPFVEELFMRSWLLRYAEIFDRRTDFRDVPIAHFSWRSFAIVIAFFVLSHAWWWEYPLMLVWAVGTQLWFYHRGHLMPLVLVHAVTNLSILAFVVVADGRFHDASGDPISLWFFI